MARGFVIEGALHAKLRATLQAEIHAAGMTQQEYAVYLGLHKYYIQGLFWKGGTAAAWRKIAAAQERLRGRKAA